MNEGKTATTAGTVQEQRQISRPSAKTDKASNGNMKYCKACGAAITAKFRTKYCSDECYHKKQRELNIENSRRWYRNNREKARETSKRWYKNNPERSRENNRRWYQNNADKVKKDAIRWQKDNPEKHQGAIKKMEEKQPGKGQ